MNWNFPVRGTSSSAAISDHSLARLQSMCKQRTFPISTDSMCMLLPKGYSSKIRRKKKKKDEN